MNGDAPLNFDRVDQGRVEQLRDFPAFALDTARDQDDPLEVSIAGDFLMVSTLSTGVARIRFNSRQAARHSAEPGDTFRGATFRRIYLDWTAQAGKTLTVAYGTGQQIAPGAVRLRDAIAVEIAAPSNEFVLGTSIGPVAAEYSQVQLLNPAGSGRNIILLQAVVSTDVDDTVVLLRHDTVLGVAALGGPHSKMLDNPISVAEVRRNTDPVQVFGDNFGRVETSSTGNVDLVRGGGLTITPGQGLLMRPNSVNVACRAVLTIREIDP